MSADAELEIDDPLPLDDEAGHIQRRDLLQAVSADFARGKLRIGSNFSGPKVAAALPVHVRTLFAMCSGAHSLTPYCLMSPFSNSYRSSRPSTVSVKLRIIVLSPLFKKMGGNRDSHV
jgi:hypothetical protein